MPLFRCEPCGCVENTALGEFWEAKAAGKPVRCSECATGTWHGRFEKRPAVGMHVDETGYLWSAEIVEKGQVPPAYKIVGRIEC